MKLILTIFFFSLWHGTAWAYEITSSSITDNPDSEFHYSTMTFEGWHCVEWFDIRDNSTTVYPGGVRWWSNEPPDEEFYDWEKCIREIGYGSDG